MKKPGSIPFLMDEDPFPPVDTASADGLLAIGMNLSPSKVLEAYAHGAFPWFNEGEPVLWWCPDPRCVFDLNHIKVSKSMKQVQRSNRFSITLDQAFFEVIQHCRNTVRPGQDGTWITDEIIDAYYQLHQQGLAHSVEVWEGDLLVGGLYGISLGGMFFGESMFSLKSNASKFALIELGKLLKSLEFDLVDCQVKNDHLMSLGAQLISRNQFINDLKHSLLRPTIQGNWGELFGMRR